MRRDLKELTGPIGDKLVDIHKAVAEFLYMSLLRTTPVKSGKLVGGWTFNRLGAGGRTNRFRIMPPIESSLLEIYPRGATIIIRNDVEYGPKQNDSERGSFVELSMAELIAYAKTKGATVQI